MLYAERAVYIKVIAAHNNIDTVLKSANSLSQKAVTHKISKTAPI
jgi:hypothetical protein